MKIRSSLPWLAACTLLLAPAACEKKAPVQTPQSAPAPTPVPTPPKLVSAEPTSFDAIAKHLDAGGGLYFFLSTEGFLKNASASLSAIIPVILDAAKIDGDAKTKADAAWASLSRFTANSGLNEISGFGSSSIALEPGYYQSKWMLHHYEGKGNGLLWQLSSPTPNAVDFASYLPEKTVLASSGNLKLTPVWTALQGEAAQNPDLRQGLDLAATQFKQATGLDLPALLASLGPNYSMLITLDESRQTTVPAGPAGATVTMPEPGFALLVQVQDDVLINRLDQQLSALPMITKTDEPELKFRTLAMPMPMPFLRPAIAWKQGLLILASNDQLVREMFEVKAGKKPGLAATPQFQKLMKGMPTNGSGFGFMLPSFEKTVRQVQMATLPKGTSESDRAVQKLMELISNMGGQEATVSVSEDTPEGWLGTSHGGTDPAAKVAAIGAAVPVALAGIAVPAFMQSRKQVRSIEGHNQAVQLKNDLRILDAATDQWALEKTKPKGTQPTTDDLLPYIKPGTPLHQRLASVPGATSVPSGIPGTPEIVIPPLDTPLTVPAEIVQKFESTCPAEFWKPYQPK